MSSHKIIMPLPLDLIARNRTDENALLRLFHVNEKISELIRIHPEYPGLESNLKNIFLKIFTSDTIYVDKIYGLDIEVHKKFNVWDFDLFDYFNSELSSTHQAIHYLCKKAHVKSLPVKIYSLTLTQTTDWYDFDFLSSARIKKLKNVIDILNKWVEKDPTKRNAYDIPLLAEFMENAKTNDYDLLIFNG